MVLIDILLGVITGLLILAVFLMVTLNIPGVYMFLYAHEEWKYWNVFSRNVDKFEYVGRYAGDGKSYEFYWDDYKAIVWYEWKHYDGCSSVHSKDGKECFCSMYWESKSKKFADKLMCKLPIELK